MVLDDAAVMNITEAQLERVWRPKVEGAWRLHHATAEDDLDWFVLFSSMVSLIGNPGQGAYAAANSWLDSFAAWRAARGLPALAVNWGPWGETGVATGFAARGYQTIPTDEGLDALATLLAHRRVRTAVIPGEPDTWIPSVVRQSSLLSGLAGERDTTEERDSAGADSNVRADVEGAAPGLARRTVLETYLADHIRDVLRLGSATLDPQVSLRSLGFDSLLAMELASRLETGLGITLPANFVWTHPTVAAMAGGIAERMQLSLDR
jgi:polyketide synthase 2/polyketide synthase 5